MRIEVRLVEIIQSEEQKKNEAKWTEPKRPVASTKHTNIRIMGVPMGEEKEKAERTLEEIMAKNFPNFDERLET